MSTTAPTVRTLMTYSVWTLSPEDPVLVAAETLLRAGVSGAPVVDESGRLRGLVSELDLLAAMSTPGGADFVHEVMVPDVSVAHPDDDLATIAERFRTQPYRRLPVVEEDNVLGIVSRRDVLEALVNREKPRDRYGRKPLRERGPLPATAGELMTPQPITVPRDTPIATLAMLLYRHRLRHVPVVDSHGVLVGLVTEAGVYRHGAMAGDPPGLWIAFEPGETPHTAADLLTGAKVVVRPDLDLAAVLERLRVNKHEVAVVVDEDCHPIGILAEQDAVRLAAASLSPGLLAESAGSVPIHAVGSHEPAQVALQIMQEHRVRHVLVTEGTELVGVVSWRDLAAERQEGRQAGQLVRNEMFTVGLGTSLVTVAQQMVRRRIGCVPIVDGEGTPTAIVTRSDLVRALGEELQRQKA